MNQLDGRSEDGHQYSIIGKKDFEGDQGGENIICLAGKWCIVVARKDRTITGFSRAGLLPRPRPPAHNLMRMRPEEFHFSVFNYAKLILASHARQTDSFCMSCIYVHNDAFHCRQGGFARAGAYKHHRQSGRGFVTIGDKTSAKARSLRLCFGNYLYFPTSSLV